jgi:hypothetical protein
VPLTPVFVSAQMMPWQFVVGGFNDAWTWADSFGLYSGYNGLAPLVVPVLVPGATLTITYLSGSAKYAVLTNPPGFTTGPKGAGVTGANPSYPTSRIASETFTGIAGLIGAFTDSAGNVIAAKTIGGFMHSPGVAGDQVNLTAPAGATQLQLGINQEADQYNGNDNTTGFNLSVYQPPSTVGADPQIILRVSNDGGFTWGNERQASMGKMGDYKKLVRWRRLGRSNNRAYQVICTEPVFVALIAADLDVS